MTDRKAELREEAEQTMERVAQEFNRYEKQFSETYIIDQSKKAMYMKAASCALALAHDNDGDVCIMRFSPEDPYNGFTIKAGSFWIKNGQLDILSGFMRIAHNVKIANIGDETAIVVSLPNLWRKI